MVWIRREAAEREMDWTDFLFSFNGRINRAKYWFSVLLNIIVSAAAVWVGLQIADIAPNPILPGAVILTAFFFVIYSSAAVGVKRLHDREKSGWWLVGFYVVPSLLGPLGIGVPELVFVLFLLSV